MLRVALGGSISEDGPCIPTRRECEHFRAQSTRRAEAEEISDADAYDAILNDNNSWIVPDEQVTDPDKPDEGTISTQVYDLEEVIAMARSLPQNASKEDVRKILWSLPCLRVTNPETDKAIVPGIKCYANSHAMGTMFRQYKDKKVGLYVGAMLRYLVPERVLAMPHVTARRNTTLKNILQCSWKTAEQRPKTDGPTASMALLPNVGTAYYAYGPQKELNQPSDGTGFRPAQERRRSNAEELQWQHGQGQQEVQQEQQQTGLLHAHQHQQELQLGADLQQGMLQGHYQQQLEFQQGADQQQGPLQAHQQDHMSLAAALGAAIINT
ncbi:hypothetical protein KUF71_019775 [Frankliniella fusca]|uniref:Uncharacterized protein n=1 Tax=Frankliniella fusca TaxID=407009 RepID=A0AAE1GVX9_9NEOP|nr:hypothetical protein KUF71_019775 [Frankliniella fusca]